MDSLHFYDLLQAMLKSPLAFSFRTEMGIHTKTQRHTRARTQSLSQKHGTCAFACGGRKIQAIHSENMYSHKLCHKTIQITMHYCVLRSHGV